MSEGSSHGHECPPQKRWRAAEDWWQKNIGMLSRRDVHGGEARPCLRFVLRPGEGDDEDGQPVTMTRHRVRVVGSCPTLGAWDVAGGADLLWQGGEWISLLIEVQRRSVVEFRILRGGPPRWRNDWSYEWSRKFTVRAPDENTVLEVLLSNMGADQELPHTWSAPRPDFLARPLAALHPPGEQRCYTFDASNGVTLHYALHLPRARPGDDGVPPQPGVGDACASPSRTSSGQAAPLLLFLHAMYNRLDGDNSMFYDSDMPPRLLLDGGLSDEVPYVLQHQFICLSPQCPPDPAWCDGVGTWLQQGWYTDNERPDPGSEAALWELLEAVCRACNADPERLYVTGCSMGGFACLELAARRPNYFAAVVPVAAHYEDDIEDLVRRLAPARKVPFWFFHAVNDQSCPFATIKHLFRRMRSSFFEQVYMTSYEDTWSKTGHASDVVAYTAGPCGSAGRPYAMGNELFDWLLQQRRPSQQ